MNDKQKNAKAEGYAVRMNQSEFEFWFGNDPGPDYTHIYGDLNEEGFEYYQDNETGTYHFVDNNDDYPLTGPIDPYRVVWDEHAAWVYDDGTDLPWEEE